jgi:hypothetical protein
LVERQLPKLKTEIYKTRSQKHFKSWVFCLPAPCPRRTEPLITWNMFGNPPLTKRQIQIVSDADSSGNETVISDVSSSDSNRDLNLVVDAWPSLAQHLRSAVLALVESANRPPGDHSFLSSNTD